MNSVPQSSGIYRITCIPTSKIYIGSSANIQLRWYRHIYALTNGNHHNRHLQNAWMKYGADSFTIDVVELCDKEILIEREQYYLDLLKPFSPNGFNLAYDAIRPQLGRVMSAETREKLGAAKRGKPLSADHKAKLSLARRGRKYTPEAIANMSKAQKGHYVAPETGRKISAALTGRKLSPEHAAQAATAFLGKTHSDETKAKISAAHMGIGKGTKASDETKAKQSAVRKKHYIVTTPDGVEIEVIGLEAFCKEHGLDAPTMSNVANGVYKHHKKWLCRHA